MTSLLDDMFRPESFGDEGSAPWTQELFRRAYALDDGPFERVCTRLRLGYSVLAYVPGNCMGAAAAIVKQEVADKFAWTDYLEHPGGDSTLEDVWKAAPGLVTNLRRWFSPERAGNTPPAGIFHNLDFLSDGHGAVFNYPAALTALAGLVSGVRQGVVLGLSDRDEPVLPNAIARAFSEQIRIDEIPYQNFHRLIPIALGNKLDAWGSLNDGAIRLIASRLRWTDPPRVARILSLAHTGQTSLEGVFQKIVNSTQTVNFQSAGDVYAGGRPVGVSAEVLTRLEEGLIKPYKQWTRFTGDHAAYVRALRKLPPGAILHGPPGTGKTHLARWIAHDIGLPVRAVSGGELRAGVWGDAERNVRALFRDLRRAAPCVLVLDDADDLLPDRRTAEGSLASAEVAVVGEFLRQLDGFAGRLEGVVVILTTNLQTKLDPAVLTRLPLQVRVPYPVGAAQLGEIVRRVAVDYHYTLTPEVIGSLVERFSLPIGENVGPPELATKNYFSPREIQQAMRMLERWEGPPGAAYAPSTDDVARMRSYYDGLGA